MMQRGWPSNQRHVEHANATAYGVVLRTFPASVRAKAGLSNIEGDNGRHNFALALRRWVTDMLQCGSIASKPGGAAKEDRHNMEAYAQLYAYFEMGWVDSKGNVRGYRDLQDLEDKIPEARRIINSELKLQHRSVWQNLRKFYPSLITVQERFKKTRDAKATQHWAKQILGLEPIHWHRYIPRHLVAEGLRWNPARSHGQFFLDALSVEGKDWLRLFSIVWIRGKPQTAVENPLSNAGVRTLPKIMLYIAVHEEHGMLLYFTATGSQGGKAEAWEGYKCWADKLSPEMRQHLIASKFCNTDAAIAGAEARGVDWASVPYKEAFRVRVLMAALFV